MRKFKHLKTEITETDTEIIANIFYKVPVPVKEITIDLTQFSR